MGIIPDEFIDGRDNPQMTDCMRFLIGEQPNYIKKQLWDPVKQEPFAVFPKKGGEYYYLQNVLSFVHSSSHSKKDEDTSYVIDSCSKDLFFGITLQLSHLIAFYGKYVDEHKDIDSNKSLHRDIPQEPSEEPQVPLESKSEMIKHKVFGPITVDEEGYVYIEDVQIHESFKCKAGEIHYTNKVHINTGPKKDTYKYYAPKAYKK